MVEATPIVVPLENANDLNLILVAWLVKDGEQVREGQSIAEMETSKAVVELSSPANGRVKLVARHGDRLEVGAVIGQVAFETASAVETERNGLSGAADSAQFDSPREMALLSSFKGVRFSRKALELIGAHGLEQAYFAGNALVREQDVLDFLEHAALHETVNGKLPFQLRDVSLRGVTLPSGWVDTADGRIDREFLAHLSRNTEAFGKLTSEEKCSEYAKYGAAVGRDVVIGNGSTIIAPRIVLGEGVEIGEHSSIQCRESFTMGALSSFRAGNTVRGGIVLLGQNVHAGSRIQIGGGGHADPWSLLFVGDNTFLGDDLFINICRPVAIGKEVFLTQRAILVTHNIGQSVLDGYENCCEPIVLEDYCQVGMASTLYPGVRIGRSAIVASNSYVISSIPEGKLAIGVPARVVRDAARSLDRDAQFRVALEMVRDFHELLKLKGVEVSELAEDQFTATLNGERYKLNFTQSYTDSEPANARTDVRVYWALDSCNESPLDCTVFNLLKKTVSGATNIFTDSAREFLRKRGIRFQPGPWRYRQGLI